MAIGEPEKFRHRLNAIPKTTTGTTQTQTKAVPLNMGCSRFLLSQCAPAKERPAGTETINSGL